MVLRELEKRLLSAFLIEGANVTIAARNIDFLEKAKEDLGEKVSIIQADITIKSEREKLMRLFVEKNGTIDVLVNNAGGSNGSTVTETGLDLFYEAMELNYFSAVHLSKLAVEEMKKNRSGSHY